MLEKKVLLIEDEKDLADCVCNLLEGLSFSVTVLADIEQVLKYLNDNINTNLVLMDAFLRGKKSIDLLPRIKELNGKPKVVMMSGEIQDNIRNQSLQKGADAYIQKPFTFEDLENVLQIILKDEGI